MSNTSNSTIVTSFVVVRTVAEGHRMVLQGWALFKEAVEAEVVGDLPQLLCHLRGMITLISPQHQHQYQFQWKEWQPQQQADLHSHW